VITFDRNTQIRDRKPDPPCANDACAQHHKGDKEDDASRFEPSFNPASAAIVVRNEDPTASPIERSGIARDVIGDITSSPTIFAAALMISAHLPAR
jgi:hypothetical protein